ncbi:hypothetical protein CWI38_1594p0020 [Hamiltosporidium tvaerminnensis]|uniref:Uncharacterized protein n=1 Tax=Hamiltosporidium tvaerminnensis TaxID=1176355 RepID=A0A4V2JX74_9MICR|nr:hypothetical protein CWI38_1594p0020 [Hamiltosporidium tvaerminnensis]
MECNQLSYGILNFLTHLKYVFDEKASMGVIMRAEMHEEPTPPLKEEKREEDGAKNLKPKNNIPFISQVNHFRGTDQ